MEFSPFAFIKHLGFYPCLFQIHPASPYPRVLAQADGHPWISTPSPSRKGLSFPIREDSELVSSIVCLCSDHQLFLMSKIQPYSFRFTKPQLTHVGATAYSLRNVLHILKCIFLHTWEYTFIALPFPHDCNYINTNTFYTYFVLVIFSFQQSNSIALSFSWFTTAEHFVKYFTPKVFHYSPNDGGRVLPFYFTIAKILYFIDFYIWLHAHIETESPLNSVPQVYD